MKELAISLTMAFCLCLLLLGRHATAGPNDLQLNWGSQVNAGQCPNGPLVINITHQVTNDGDSGIAGWWAYDNYNRHIQVWQVAPNTFCALARYQGYFTTISGHSPQDTDPSIAAGIQGTFEGGYRATIIGTLNPSPVYPARGNIGTFDYGWDGHPGHGAHTPFSWLGAYFTSVSSFDFNWWGWVYHGGRNGTWVNASTGNKGDITD